MRFEEAIPLSNIENLRMPRIFLYCVIAQYFERYNCMASSIQTVTNVCDYLNFFACVCVCMCHYIHSLFVMCCLNLDLDLDTKPTCTNISCSITFLDFLPFPPKTFASLQSYWSLPVPRFTNIHPHLFSRCLANKQTKINTGPIILLYMLCYEQDNNVLCLGKKNWKMDRPLLILREM